MKRLGRWLFNLAAVASGVILVMAVAAWPLSYTSFPYNRHSMITSWLRVTSKDGPAAAGRDIRWDSSRGQLELARVSVNVVRGDDGSIGFDPILRRARRRRMNRSTSA